MKNYKTFIIAGIVSCTLCSSTGWGQDLISPQSATSTTTSSVISWAIGEVFVETLEGGAVVLSQGSLRSDLIVTGIIANNSFEDVEAFPNPVSQVVYVKNNSTDLKLNYIIVSMGGNLYEKGSISGEFNQINFANYAVGTYILRFANSKQNKFKSFNIQKVR